ncbi:MAG: hypothetical protein L6R35_007617 [Caloplaca aegaea]|nr:MAG: hypothetical protein L6R35_007617 [Caloplaca aegaea]
MFEKNADGSFVRGKEEEKKKKKKKESKKVERLFWTELPEFSHLSTYRPLSLRSSSSSSEDLPLRERVTRLATTATADDAKELKTLVRAAVLDFLARTLGFEAESLDPGGKGLGFYGLDSLSAAGCQYWCFKEFNISVTVTEIFAATSIDSFADFLCEKIIHTRDMTG